MNAKIKENSSRERLLLMVFPAAIAVAIYSVIFAVPMQRTNTQLKNELVQQESIAVSPAVADQARQLLTIEQKELARLQAQLANSKHQIRQLSQSWRAGTTRLGTFEKVSELMRDYNLSIVSQGDEEETIVSQYIQNLFDLINQQEPDDPIVFWQVEVKGSYFSVVDFLTAVDEKADHIVPIGISMEPDKDTSQKKWTIVFAI